MKTQGRTLIEMLRKRGMTTMQLIQTGISTCPWRRIAESLHECETLDKKKNNNGIFVYRVIYKPATVWQQIKKH